MAHIKHTPIKQGAVKAARCGRVMIGAYIIFAMSLITDSHCAPVIRVLLAVLIPVVTGISLRFMRGYMRIPMIVLSSVTAVLSAALCCISGVDIISLARFISTGLNPLSAGVFAVCLIMYSIPSLCFLIIAVTATTDKKIKLFCRARLPVKRKKPSDTERI